MTPADLARIHAAAMPDARTWSTQEFAALSDAAGSLLTVSGPAFAVGRILLDEAEILMIACDPASQGQGHGRRALAMFERDASAQGATRVLLEVASDNLAALGLYEAQGYREDGRRRGYYSRTDGPPVDAILMSRTLNDAP